MDIVFEGFSQLEGELFTPFLCLFDLYVLTYDLFETLNESTTPRKASKLIAAYLEWRKGISKWPCLGWTSSKSQVSLVKSHSFSSFGLVFKFYIPFFDSIDGIFRNFPSLLAFFPGCRPMIYQILFALMASRAMGLDCCCYCPAVSTLVAWDLKTDHGWLYVGAWRPPNNPLLIEVAWWIFTMCCSLDEDGFSRGILNLHTLWILSDEVNQSRTLADESMYREIVRFPWCHGQANGSERT